MTLLYFWIGNQMSLLNKRQEWIKNYIHNLWGVISLFLLLAADVVLANVIVPPLNIRLNILGVHVPSLCLVLAGTLLTIQAAFLLEKNNLTRGFFKYIGEYSIVLIGFSQITLQLLKAVFDVAHVTGIVNVAGRYILLWLILLLLIWFTSTYFPVIIGKSKK